MLTTTLSKHLIALAKAQEPLMRIAEFGPMFRNTAFAQVATQNLAARMTDTLKLASASESIIRAQGLTSRLTLSGVTAERLNALESQKFLDSTQTLAKTIEKLEGVCRLAERLNLFSGMTTRTLFKR